MKIHEAINQRVPIREVLKKIPAYEFRWSSIIYKWSVTDGYKINFRGNYLNNFTPWKEDRPTWGPRNIVKRSLPDGASYKEIVDWFEENFNLSELLGSDYKKYIKNKSSSKQSKKTLYEDNPKVIYKMDWL